MPAQSSRIRFAGYSVPSEDVRLSILHARLNRLLASLGKVRVVVLDAMHKGTAISRAKRIGTMLSNVLHAGVLGRRACRPAALSCVLNRGLFLRLRCRFAVVFDRL